MSAAVDWSGLQPERTALAWRRTGSGAVLVTVGIVGVHGVATGGHFTLAVIASTTIALLLAFFTHHQARLLGKADQIRPFVCLLGIVSVILLGSAYTTVMALTQLP